MSRALSNTEARWTTIEKECYAIVYSLQKFEHLIRDVHFTLRTDHKNLTYVNESRCPKVHRWKVLIQEYDFDLEYIPGPQNYIADAFSRLVPIEEPELLCLIDKFEIPQEKYKLISEMHNSQVGHFGVDKTLNKLEALYPSWTYMREHVRRFIRQCPCCQKMSQLKTPIHTLNFTSAAYEPMERVNVDSIGPLPEDENGYKYIIVMIDSFTRMG